VSQYIYFIFPSSARVQFFFIYNSITVSIVTRFSVYGINMSQSDLDFENDVSLDGQLARDMFYEDSSPNPTPELQPEQASGIVDNMFRSPISAHETNEEKLKLSAARSSNDVFIRYLEGLKSQMEVSLAQVQTKLSDLGSKYESLSQFVNQGASTSSSLHPTLLPKGLIPPVLPTVSVSENPSGQIATTALVSHSVPMGEDSAMEVEEPSAHGHKNYIDCDASHSESSSGPQKRNSNYFVRHSDRHSEHRVREEPYRVRKVDAVKLRPLDKKLDNEDQFKYWKRSVVGQLETQDCIFVLDPSEPAPGDFSERDRETARKKVRYFIFESLSQYFQDLVQDLRDPKDIMEKLQNTCDPSSKFQLKRLVNEFNSIHFDPKREKAVEFLGRFDQIRNKLTSINADMLTPEYVKTIFELSIDETVTYQKAELHGFRFSLGELRDMLLEEQLRNEQSSLGGSSYSLMRSRTAFAGGRGGSRGGKGSVARGGLVSGSNKIPMKKPSSVNMSKGKAGYCVYCRRKGHTRAACFKANKTCFNCGLSNQHIAKDCPNPPNNLVQIYQRPKNPKRLIPKNSRQASLPNRPKTLSVLNRPKLFTMPLGQAKRLAQEFKGHPDSVFAIIGSTDGDDNSQVWVTMGDEEEQVVGTFNFVSERQGKGAVFQLSEGEKEPWA